MWARILFLKTEKKIPVFYKKYGDTCGQGLVLFHLDITKCPLASIHTEITKNVSNMKYSRSELIAILDTRKK